MDRIRDALEKSLLLTIGVGVFCIWILFSTLVYFVEMHHEGSNLSSFLDALWWGIVTMLTVGYGDHYPVSHYARILAIPLMITGVVSIGVITAKIASIFMHELMTKRRYKMKRNLSDHIVICGWKNNMISVLDSILFYNTDISPDHVVLIADFSDDDLQGITSNPKFKGINIVCEAPHHLSAWSIVNAQKARKILILADQTRDANGHPPTPHEADARTIMTAHTIQKLATGVMVTAEILDNSLEEQLHMAGVSDIIFSREYNKLLLGNASGGTGINNVLYDLVNPKYGSIINTIKIEKKYLGKEYSKFKTDFEREMPHMQIIGLLENVGNIHSLKQNLVKKAQSSPDIKSLVSNLQTINKLKCNEPKFHVEDHYVVPENTMAIVIEKADEHLKQCKSS